LNQKAILGPNSHLLSGIMSPHQSSILSGVDSIPKVLIYPDMNSDFVIESLKEAKESIAFSVLSIPTQEFAEEIVNARDRGVKIYLTITNPFFEVGVDYPLLSQKFETDIQTLKNMKERLQRDIAFLNTLTDNNIYPHYLNRKYYVNHQKLLIVDDLAFIATSPKCEKRDFCFTISNKEKVDALRDFFFRDYNLMEHTGECLEKLGFVVGPENQRKKLEDFLLTAKQSIHIYASDFNDKSICSIIESLLQKSVEVYVLNTPNFFGFNEQSLNTHFYLKRICQFGAKVRIVREPFIHSKVIMIDMGDDILKRMYFGSCNIFNNSIDHSRELGLITQSDEYIAPVFHTFLKDWNRGANF
jgi:phosphatidylserine/phosphatidylglycerophosphate/cardiolipin synthase-like enzyme